MYICISNCRHARTTMCAQIHCAHKKTYSSGALCLLTARWGRPAAPARARRCTSKVFLRGERRGRSVATMRTPPTHSSNARCSNMNHRKILQQRTKGPRVVMAACSCATNPRSKIFSITRRALLGSITLVVSRTMRTGVPGSMIARGDTCSPHCTRHAAARPVTHARGLHFQRHAQ